jgi:putative ABC transport system permease protein
MQELLADFRYATRTLWKNPGFTLVAVLALALGTGATTAIFSVVDAVLLRPLPYSTADRLVGVLHYDSKRGPESAALSYPDFRDFRSQNHTLDHMAVYHPDSWPMLAPGKEPVNVHMAVVSADLFPMLAVHPAAGRTFTAAEDEDTAGPMKAILSDYAWRKLFGGDQAILGKTVLLRQQPYTIIGIMPRGFQFPIQSEPTELWTTFGYSPDLRKTSPESTPMGIQRGAHFLDFAATLKPGVSTDQARADLAVINTRLAKQFRNSNQYREVQVLPMLDHMVAQLRPVLLLLLGAVGCVLLIACANVANLLLARATTRSRELAIRTALGAGRARLVRQILTESVLLSLLGGVFGLLLAAWGTALLAHYGPQDVPRLADARLNVEVFVFALAMSLVTGLVFGAVPALRAANSSPGEALKDGSRGSTEGLRHNKARSILVIAEVALALMLLSSAGLLIRSLDRLNHTNAGYDTANVLTGTFDFPESRYPDAKLVQALDSLEAKLSALPNVIAASDVVVLPLAGDDMSTGIDFQGKPVSSADRPITRVNIAAPNYFRAMGTPLLAGRDFNSRDVDKAPEVVIVNQAFVQQFFPNENPIGKRVRPGFGHGGGEPPMREIVGVVASVQQDRIGKKSLPEVFMPRGQFPNTSTAVVVRTTGDAHALIPAFRSAVRAIDPDLPIGHLRTMEDWTGLSLAQPRFQSYLFVIFGAIALLLTAVGLYGVIAYSVAQRTQEIGTRMALGAQQANILKLVVGEGMLLAILGAVIGIAGALGISGLLQKLVYEVSPTDPATIAAITVTILCVSLLAAYVPARRAARIDPMTALRNE